MATEIAALERSRAEAAPVEDYVRLSRSTLRVITHTQTLTTALLQYTAWEHAKAEQRDDRIRLLHTRLTALERKRRPLWVRVRRWLVRTLEALD